MLQYLRSLPVETLLSKSVQNFVGNRSTPRNPKILNLLMNIAYQKAKNDVKLMTLVKYYSAFFSRLKAIEQKNKILYDRASYLLKELADNGHSLSNYVLGRDLLKSLQQDQPQQLIKMAEKVNKIFLNSINDRQYGGLCFIADYHQRLKNKNQIYSNLQNIQFQLYSQSASLGHALSIFRLAQMYAWILVRKYLLEAAQMGVVQAQCNLAEQYTNGVYFPKDEVKSFCWYMQASTNEHTYSKYQLSKILAKGTDCGRVLPNKKMALKFLQEIKQSGQLNVDKDIEEINAAINK